MNKRIKLVNIESFEISRKDTENAIFRFIHMTSRKIKVEIYFTPEEINKAWIKAVEKNRGKINE